MFTLGDKLRVLNVDDVQIFDNTGAELTTTALVTAAAGTIEKFRINGFGTFNIADLRDVKCRRATNAVLDSREYTVALPTSLVIGDAVEVSVRFKTDRYQGELTNQYIEGGRPVVFSTRILTAVPTAANVRTAIVQGWADFKSLFAMADLPIEVSNGTAATDVRVTSTIADGSVTITEVTVKRVAQGIAQARPTKLVQSVLVAAGMGAIGSGKFLEESVQMGTMDNIRPYGMDTTGTQVDLRANYTQISFTTETVRDGEDLSTIVAGHSDIKTKQSFTVWFNEGLLLGADGAVTRLAETFVQDLSLAVNGVAVTAAGVNELTGATAAEEVLFLANGLSTDTALLFIA